MERHQKRPTLLMEIDEYLSEPIRQAIEQNYYAKINEQAVLERLIHDEHFLANPTAHVAMFSDHGVVHVRDVAQQVLRVLNTSNGVLIPERDRARLQFMGGYGVMAAYLHDIGMRDFSAFGRAMHPESAAQLVFCPDCDDIIEMIWETNCGNVAWRLLNMDYQGRFQQAPLLVLREMLSLSACHSKSKVPVEVLNTPRQLRKLMQRSIGTDLRYLYHQQQIATLQQHQAYQNQDLPYQAGALPQKLEQATITQQEYLAGCPDSDWVNHELTRIYHDFERESFLWLLSPDPVVCELVHDVIDTVRALRAADALRQRGSVLKTSAAHEIMVDHQSANAVYALRSHNDAKLFFIETQDPISAGEANLASSELDRDGNLRLSFHRGQFATDEATQWAAYCVAGIINDIQADVIGSFKRDQALEPQTLPPPRKTHEEIQILVEGVDDHPHFAQLVCQELWRLNPAIGKRSRPLPSFQHVDPAELRLYLNGRMFDWTREQRCHLLKHIFGEADEHVSHIDLTHAFLDVRIIALQAGEQLIKAGSCAGFVFIPLSEGLRVFPLGGYTSVCNPAYVSIGNTGVIRGALRNATVIAELPVEVLMIPKQVYLAHWHRTYPPGAIPRLLGEETLDR